MDDAADPSARTPAASSRAREATIPPGARSDPADAATEATAAATEAAIARARELFLDDANVHGCAETSFVVLKEVYRLPDAADSSAAMALNGGIAYRGGPCGAFTGAALAVGLLAERRIPNHREAKRAARLVVGRVIDGFAAEHGSTACRDLIGMDLRSEAGHRAFIESGIWRDRCMRQIEWVVGRLAPLAADDGWAAALADAAATDAGDSAGGAPPGGEPDAAPARPDPRTLPA